MRRGLPWTVLLLVLLAAYGLLQRAPPALDHAGAAERDAPASQTPSPGSRTAAVLDGAVSGDADGRRSRQGSRRVDAVETGDARLADPPAYDGSGSGAESHDASLPPQARDTLRRIVGGGPFRHRQDGATFGNRERLLPRRERGWYREYTVETPGSRDRGARRIVAGGDPPREFFYTDDHYRSFRRIEAPAR